MVIKSSDKALSPFSGSTDEKRSSLRQALPQILAVCVKNVLLLGFGMTLGFPTILIPSLSGNNPNESFSLGQEAISWIGSINLICVPVGCLLSGAITQPIGRKRAMQFVNIPFLAAWLLFHFASDVWQVFLALAITGVTGGLLEAPTLTYVAEITHPSLRGTLASTSAVAVIGGVLVQFLFGTFLTWRTTALVNCVFPVLSFFLLFFVPESPHWLISKNRFLDAQKSLAWLRGWTSFEEIQLEFQDLCQQMGKSDEKSEEKSSTFADIMKMFTQKNFLWPFLLVCFTFFLSHFSGTTTLQVYAIKIFSTLNSPIDKYYATLIMGVAEMLGCILSTCLVYYFGKRLMNFFSLIGCGLCFLVVASCAYIHDIKYLKIDNNLANSVNSTETGNWLPTTLLITAAFFTHCGIKILPWLLLGEVFFTEIRAMGSGLAGAVSYIFSFVANKIFLSMISLFTLAGTFWFYSFICFGGTIILYFILPETEGKTLFEITEHFASNVKLTNKVKHHKKKKENGETNKGYVDEIETLTYVAEITQPKLRGTLASTSTVAVISGILIQFLLGTFLNWRTVASVSCVIPVISFILLFFVPESPHWLLSKNRFLDARKSLSWLRGWTTLDEIEAEFKELSRQLGKNSVKGIDNPAFEENDGEKSVKEATKTWKFDNLKLYGQKNFLWPYTLVSFTFLLGHFSGMTTLQTYAVKIFSTLKAPIDKYYATIILGIAEVFGCILSACLVHFVGKRVMNFFSLIGCSACFFIVATYAHIIDINYLATPTNVNQTNTTESYTDLEEKNWVPMIFLIAAAFFTHSGIRILPWMLIGEVYSSETRATASGLSGGLSYIFGFISNKIFLSMVALLTLPGSFWLYSGICFIGTIILYFVLPETEGKTLFEITEHFSGNGELDNNVHRKRRGRANGEVNSGFDAGIESKL